MTTTIATVRQSPFRETEWDRRLDNMLEDLENSAATNSGGASSATSSMQQHQSSSANVSHQMVSHSASQSSSATQQQRSASSHRQTPSSTNNKNNNNNSGAITAASDSSSQQNGYGSVLQKSKSGGSLVQENSESMLKEMDNALKASSNFIESHRSSSTGGPNSRSNTEYHEYKSYSNGGTNGGTRGGNPGGEFNLERQVQHMMPPPSPSLSGLMERSNQQRNVSSYQQQQQQTQTTYKVQSNQYSSTSNNQMMTSSYDQDMNGQDNERPGSRLKQNIDELDTLLSDLNNARKDTTPSGGQDYNLSSDDYSFSENQQGHVSKQVRSLNEYNYNQTSSSTSAKPPSPSPRRRSDGRPGGPILASPSTVRKASPSPVSTSTSRRHGREPSPPGLAGYSSSSYQSEQQQKTTTSSLQDYHRSSSPYSPDRGSPAPGPPPRSHLSPNEGTPTGVSYYTKYHSAHSHHSQQNDTNGGPITFPTSGAPTNYTQTPPKRVDELMTELSEFDPSIQPTGFIEPTGPPKSHVTETAYTSKSTTENDFGGGRNFRDRSASPPAKPQPSTPGPAVYYPPGEIFTSSSKGKYDSLDNNATHKQPSTTPVVHASHSTSLEGGRSGKANAKAEYGYKAKGRYQESSDGKQGAAVVPICLPLCCAAPCVIL